MQGTVLTDRERQILEAVIRTYVETAEPAGSRTVARRFELGVSAATIRNAMSDLEEKGFLFHPHTSAGRIPTDQAYRYYVDGLMGPLKIAAALQKRLRKEIKDGQESTGPLERLLRRALRALGLITGELGIAVAPRLDEVVLEKIDLVLVASEKIMLVLTLKNGVVRTVYVDIPVAAPTETLAAVTMILNERLSGLTLAEVRTTLGDRLRDAVSDDPQSQELMNIFLQSANELMSPVVMAEGDLVLGQASVLASQPEFAQGAQLRGLIELTEQRDLLKSVLDARSKEGGPTITIGSEHGHPQLSPFTLITSEYRVGGLTGVLGVMGPTRMPYEKVAAIVEYTSLLMGEIADRSTSAGR
jgi:heat-inducible transcriptional repressor